MATRSFILCLVLIVLQSGLFAGKQLYGTNNGSISFRSDAPLELIKASSKEMRGRLNIQKKTFAFNVELSSFNGFNNPLQKEHFNENYLESSIYPTASFSGKIIEDMDLSTNGTYTVRAKGNLSIHGVVQERIIKSDITVSSRNLSIQSNFTIQLSDHDIAIPKVVHEKLASEIKVSVHADLISQ